MVVLQQEWRLYARMLSSLRSGDCAALESLLDLGLDPDTSFQLGGWARPALCLAAERGYAKLVALLCTRHCSTARPDRDGLSALHLAAVYGYTEVAAALLEHRAEINKACPGSGDTPLHLAASHNQVQMVSFLLNRGANPDVQNKDDKTPLMYAAAKGNVVPVRLLVAHDANVYATDRGGNTPLLLHTASAWLNLEVAEWLCPDREAANFGNFAGSSPVLEVVKSTCSVRQEVLRYLVKKGEDLDVTTALGSTPLHLACSNADWSSARILVRGGARLDIFDSLGRSPMFIVLQNENLLLAETMKAAGASCQLPEDLYQQLGPASKLFATRRQVDSLKYTSRRTLRRIWGRSTDSRLDDVLIPTI